MSKDRESATESKWQRQWWLATTTWNWERRSNPDTSVHRLTSDSQSHQQLHCGLMLATMSSPLHTKYSIEHPDSIQSPQYRQDTESCHPIIGRSILNTLTNSTELLFGNKIHKKLIGSYTTERKTKVVQLETNSSGEKSQQHCCHVGTDKRLVQVTTLICKRLV